ncbi:MAG: response regulator [Bacteroidetes bacterium]|nr:response regulator [Bacteroidota bacterium]
MQRCNWLDRIGERDSSLSLLEQTLRQAETLGDAGLTADTRMSLIQHFARYQLRDSLERNLDPLIEFSEKNGLSKIQVEALLYKAAHLLETQRYREAMQFCDLANEKAHPLANKRLDGLCLLHKGSVLRTSQNDSSVPLPYFYQALKILEAVGDTANIIRASLLISAGEQDETKKQEMLRRAEALSKVYPSETTQMGVLNFRAAHLSPEEGIPLLREALKISRKLRIPNMVQHLLLQLSGRYQALKQYDHAIACMDSSRAAFPNNLPDDGALHYYGIYKEMGDFEKAVAAIERFRQYEDERKQTDMKSFVAEWETRLNTREKEWELQQQQEELKNQQTRNLLLGIILLLTVIVGGGALFAFYQRGKGMKLLTRQNETIRQQAEELKSLEKLKSRFFANVSHELRTPLTLIIGPLDTVLNSGELSGRNLSLLKKAQQSGNELLKLVGSILDLSKLESGKMELHPKPTTVLPFLRQTVSAFESHADRLGIRLTFEYQAREDLQLELDREKLKTILNNFLSNALKFTPALADGAVSVKVNDLAHAIRLSVTDTGRGIHPDDLSKVFGRFYQSSRPLKTQSEAPIEGGTGIGLALCREFARLMGGNVWVESKLGEGSTFYFEFPKKEALGVSSDDIRMTIEATQETFGEIVPAPTVNHQSSIVNQTILIVEDNYSLRDFLETILSPHYLIMTAENGQVALDLLRDEGRGMSDEIRATLIPHPPLLIPDLILSDIMMPVMDGFQLLEKLRSSEQWRHIPVIMLTARADIQDRLRALRIGVDDYLLKPFDEEELLTRISNLLERYRERQAFAEQTVPLAGEETLEDETRLPAVDAAWLESLENLVRSEVQNDLLSVNWLAHKMFISERQLQRRLKLLTGLGPNHYIREVRLQEGRRLLETREATSVKEAAYYVSFKDEKYFAHIFRERFGKYPSALI